MDFLWSIFTDHTEKMPNLLHNYAAPNIEAVFIIIE